MAFNTLTTTASDLRLQLAKDEISSVQIVETYLSMIERHDKAGLQLNAIISVAPRDLLLERAMVLDAERKAGNVRSPLHGIPIILKDVIITDNDLGMPTTAGSKAFLDAKVKGNAGVVDTLLNAGLIVLAKANLTEFCGMVSPKLMPGWSSVNGQTISPYVRGGIVEGETVLGHSAPGGSSTGSAVAVAAGFSPLALGTETIGSVVTPSIRAALYAMKLTVGNVAGKGIFRISETFDAVGPMAKSVEDLEMMVDVLLEVKPQQTAVSTTLDVEWNSLKIGFADPRFWKMDESSCRPVEGAQAQIMTSYKTAAERLGEAGASTKYPVEIPFPSTLLINGKSMTEVIAFAEAKTRFEEFVQEFDDCAIRSVQDMIDYNEKNEWFPDQEFWHKALNNSTEPSDLAAAILEARRLGGPDGLDRVFNDHDISILAAPGDSPLCILAAAAGYPIGVVPLDVLKHNGRPFGICLVARAGEEKVLLRFMRKWKQIFGQRPLPLPLIEWEECNS